MSPAGPHFSSSQHKSSVVVATSPPSPWSPGLRLRPWSQEPDPEPPPGDREEIFVETVEEDSDDECEDEEPEDESDTGNNNQDSKTNGKSTPPFYQSRRTTWNQTVHPNCPRRKKIRKLIEELVKG